MEDSGFLIFVAGILTGLCVAAAVMRDNEKKHLAAIKELQRQLYEAQLASVAIEVGQRMADVIKENKLRDEGRF